MMRPGEIESMHVSLRERWLGEGKEEKTHGNCFEEAKGHFVEETHGDFLWGQ